MGAKDPKLGYYRPHPLDFELLKRLPREGSQLGFHVLALTVAALRESLNRDVPKEAHLTSSQLQARLRSMKVAGLVTAARVFGAGGTNGWQRTIKGEKFYETETGDRLPQAKPELRVVEGRGDETAQSVG
jgi:hypothetical protein